MMDATDWITATGAFLAELILVFVVAGSLTAATMIIGWRLFDDLTERQRRIDEQRRLRPREFDFTPKIPDPASAEREWRRREQLSATWPPDAGAPE